MAATNHKRRSRKKQETLELWGSLYDEAAPAPGVLPDPPDEDGGLLPSPAEAKPHFNVWKAVASLLMFLTLAAIGILVALTWVPQDLSDIQGYRSTSAAADLPGLFRRGAERHEEVVFTERDINTYLSNTLKFGQEGIFTIVARPYGVGVRIHDGYVELVIDRLIGSQVHQTVSIYLTFTIKEKEDTREISLEYRGGAPILGRMPRGGKIGLVPVPERYILMMHPAIEGLKETYDDFFTHIAQSGYLPQFVRDKHGGDNRLILYPPPPSAQSFTQP